MGPAPAVATVRRAVRSALDDVPGGVLVLVACSGGPDSLALAAATAFEAPRRGYRAGAVTVDHALQPDSAVRAEAVAHALRNFGLDPVESVRVRVGDTGGPEAAARDARYEALDTVAARHGAGVVLLGHTRDDQAETVLLGLARGSGARSLAGMPAVSGSYRRPFLGVTRSTTEAACAADGLEVWNDPHNTDPAYTRVRIRRDALPALEQALGGGVAAALTRTADLLRADADALDSWAAGYLTELSLGAPTDSDAGSGTGGSAGVPEDMTLDVHRLTSLPTAVRQRVLRRVALLAGSPAGALGTVHIRAADALVTDWRGQQGADLPGGVRVRRRYGKLLFTRSTAGTQQGRFE